MKPNLIVIMADQLRFDVLDKGYTPNIDLLRKESSCFENMYCASPLCVPSRGSFFTGKFPNTNGSLINPWDNNDAHYGDVKENINNLYTLFEEDWESVHLGKQHLFTKPIKLEKRDNSKTLFSCTEATYLNFLKSNNIPHPGGALFKTIVPEMVDGKVTKISSYSTPKTGVFEYDEKYFFDNYFNHEGLKALNNLKSKKPLLLNTMYVAPHPPYQIPKKWFDKYQEDDIYFPSETGEWQNNQSPLQMYNVTGIIGSKYNKEEWKLSWRAYLGLVSFLDSCVGELIKLLKEKGLYDNSVIIFTSDHGEMLGSHSLFQKMCMYEPSVKVPFSIKLPKSENLTPNLIIDEVSLVDVLPTICEYFNIKNPSVMDGVSLLSLIKGERIIDKKPIFIQYDGNGSRSNFQRCIIKGRWKFIADFFKDEIYYELYNLDKDPKETINCIVNDMNDTRATELLTLLKSHMKETNDLLSSDLPAIETIREKYKVFYK